VAVWLVCVLQEISEASKRAQQNVALNVNLQQECEDLKGTVAQIRLENEASAQRMRHETEAAYARKVRLITCLCHCCGTFIMFTCFLSLLSKRAISMDTTSG